MANKTDQRREQVSKCQNTNAKQGLGPKTVSVIDAFNTLGFFSLPVHVSFPLQETSLPPSHTSQTGPRCRPPSHLVDRNREQFLVARTYYPKRAPRPPPLPGPLGPRLPQTPTKTRPPPPIWPLHPSVGPGRPDGRFFTLQRGGWRRYPTDAAFLQGLSHLQRQPACIRH